MLEALDRRFGLQLSYESHDIGHASLAQHGTTYTDAVHEHCRASDGIVLGPVSHNEYPPKAQGGLNPSGELRIREREIRVNVAEGDRWPRRRRFTIAHEVGHWVLHKDDIADRVITRTIDRVPRERAKATTPEQIREREANRFAAELLMPEDRIHAAVGSHGADVVAQAERFQVSALSMAWRLFTYGYVTRRPRRSDYDRLD